jgi:sRNA-binding protein
MTDHAHLAGQPAGVVTADAAELARASLAGLLERKRRSPPAATSSPAPAPKAKRVTLADLRKAAERRRQRSERQAP